MKCIIIEDQPPAQRILKKFIEDLGNLEIRASFSDAIQAIKFLQTEKVDLIFLDIHLPKLSGLDFLKSMAHPPHIILTTAFPDYALESYDLNVVDYLLKPFSFQRFVKAVAKVPTAQVGKDQTDEPNLLREIFIKSGYEHIKVSISDIIFIKSDSDYTEIYLDQRKLLSQESLRYWGEKLGESQFSRVHKSFLINTSWVEKVAGNQIYLKGGNIVPIGRAYKESFTNRFLK
ncbi:MAG: LytTR family DNA-binding domain-containing protein [Bacteroidota bacterium]